MNSNLESNVEGVEVGEGVVNEDGVNVIRGLPSLCLLPAADYKLVLGEQNYIIEVPKKGNFKDVMDEDDELGAESFVGDFVVYDDEEGVFYPPTFTSVALAMKLYPKLKSGEGVFQIFSIKAIVTDENTVGVLGEVVDLITNECGQSNS